MDSDHAGTSTPPNEIRLDARLQVLETNDPRSLRLLGELDHGTAGDFERDVESKVREPGDLTMDLSGLSFLDSMGVRAIIRAAQSLHSSGSLILRWPSSAVARTLRLAGVGQLPHVEVVDLSPAAAPPPQRRVPPIPAKGDSRRPLYTIER
jgi:anti-anti-sigma factor